MTGFQYFPLCLSVDSSQPLLAAGCKGFNGVGCDIKMWDIRYFKPGKFLFELSEHQQDITSCQFLPNPNSQSNNNNNNNKITKSSFVTTSRDCTIKCWSITDLSPTRNSITSFSDRSSYNCLDSWFDTESQSWICYLGDMDGCVSVMSRPSSSLSQEDQQPQQEQQNSSNRKTNFTLQWKSPMYISNEGYEEEM